MSPPESSSNILRSKIQLVAKSDEGIHYIGILLYYNIFLIAFFIPRRDYMKYNI
jgi:hypothetical protein